MNQQTYDVLDVTYHLHTEPDGSSVVEVRYATSIRNGERLRTFSEYLNFETNKNKKVLEWWKHRSPDPIPITNQQAVDIANYHGIDTARRITVWYTGTNYCVDVTILSETSIKINKIW
jgi:hypothetical protein